jgi:putative membrane protein
MRHQSVAVFLPSPENFPLASTLDRFREGARQDRTIGSAREVRLSDWSLWLKSLHIMAFAAWMAAVWYLPRLMVYHADKVAGGDSSETFKIMERRLLKGIATPAMILTIVFGLWLAVTQNQLGDGWLHAKLLLVLLMAGCHGLLAAHVKKFARDERPKPARFYRMINEVPTVLFVGIVLLVILKPF